MIRSYLSLADIVRRYSLPEPGPVRFVRALDLLPIRAALGRGAVGPTGGPAAVPVLPVLAKVYRVYREPPLIRPVPFLKFRIVAAGVLPCLIE